MATDNLDQLMDDLGRDLRRDARIRKTTKGQALADKLPTLRNIIDQKKKTLKMKTSVNDSDYALAEIVKAGAR